MINIILWLLRTGCQWRNLPQEWPHWQAVYYYFDQWKQNGTFEQINAALNQTDRKQVGKEAYPSVLCIDSQSVKLSPMIYEHRGIDANKRVNGRKRTLVVDTQGRLWVVAVHPANQADGPAAVTLVNSILWRVGERLEKVYGDQAYNGVFAQALTPWSIDFVKASRPESARGFVPIAKRWVVAAMEWNGVLAGRISFDGSSKITSIPYLLRLAGFTWPIFRSCYSGFDGFSKDNFPTRS